MLRNEYSNLEEAQNRLNMLSFSESVFLQKAKVMYKVSNNKAPNQSDQRLCCSLIEKYNT